MKATLTRPDGSEMGTLSRCGDGQAQRLVSQEQVSKRTAGGDVTEGMEGAASAGPL